MRNQTWSVQAARNGFRALVEAARRGELELVTKRGAPAVVVLSVQEYERLKALEEQHVRSFVDYLLAMPRDDDTFDWRKVELRDAEF